MLENPETGGTNKESKKQIKQFIYVILKPSTYNCLSNKYLTLERACTDPPDA